MNIYRGKQPKIKEIKMSSNKEILSILFFVFITIPSAWATFIIMDKIIEMISNIGKNRKRTLRIHKYYDVNKNKFIDWKLTPKSFKRNVELAKSTIEGLNHQCEKFKTILEAKGREFESNESEKIKSLVSRFSDAITILEGYKEKIEIWIKNYSEAWEEKDALKTAKLLDIKYIEILNEIRETQKRIFQELIHDYNEYFSLNQIMNSIDKDILNYIKNSNEDNNRGFKKIIKSFINKDITGNISEREALLILLLALIIIGGFMINLFK